MDSSSDRNDVIQTQVDVGVIKAGQIETNRRLSNIEKKIDSFAFVKVDDFAEFKKELTRTYATIESIKPMRTLFWTIISALILGLITLLFALIQAHLK